MKECDMMLKLRKDYGLAHAADETSRMTAIMTLLAMVLKKEESNQKTLTAEEFDEVVSHCASLAEEAFRVTKLDIFKTELVTYKEYLTKN